ncbi:hypothetical protein GE061_009276 [Apolygus lucorum]|uniref:Hyaluronan-mediated motility receptor C-terminal domain-containing protein n=1 Tax=Apolygus lucorum TaxID=248454 RepID=A0A8S9Y032_APOLU|nr:hypothetical protein GE061_009276 [Apolygus lucorum]
MSFPKARILRFNEVSNCAPPPGKYDPKYDTKVKGAVIEKSKRFVEGKLEPAPSVTSQDSASSCSHGYNPVVTFRTPQLPRKKVISTPRSAIERPTARTPKQPTPECKSKKRLEYETEQNLIEQINELTRVHTSQLLDKDQELAALQQELATLRASLSKAENNHINDYNMLKQRYEMEIQSMKGTLDEVITSAEVKKAESEKLILDLSNQVKILEENIKNCNSINSDLEYQLAEAKIDMIEMKNEFAHVEEKWQASKAFIDSMICQKETEMKQFNTAYEEQLKQVAYTAEENLNDLVTKMKKKLTILERELDIERVETYRDFIGKIDNIADEVRDKVELFESGSSILQFTIRSMAEDFDKKISDLVDSIGKVAEMGEAKSKENLDLTEELAVCRASCLEKKINNFDLQNKVEELRTRLTQLTNQCRKFEIVQNEANKTIHVLSQRLFESESEVERLNDTTEELCLRKDALEEKVMSVVNENSLLKMKINELQHSLIRDVKEVETLLISKVESYRRIALEETQKFKVELDEKQRDVQMLMEQVEFYRAKSSESLEIINVCQSRIDNYKLEVKELTKNFEASQDLKVQLNSELEAKDNLVLKLNAECEHLKMELGEARQKSSCLASENEELTENIKEMTEMIVEKDLKLEAISQEFGECKSIKDNLTARIVSLMNDLLNKEAQCENLTQDIEVKNLTMVQVSEEYEKVKRLYDEECRRAEELDRDNMKYIGELVSDLVLEKQKYSDLDVKQAELTEKLMKLEQSTNEMTDEILRVTNDKSTLEFRILELEKNLKTCEEEKTNMVKEKDDLVEIVKRQWDERELLTNQIESQQEEIAELKQMKDDRFEEEKAIYQAELQNEIFALQQNLEDTQKHAIDLQNRNDELIFKLNSAEADFTASEVEKDRQERNLKELIEKLSSLETKYAAMEKRKSEYKIYATELEAEKSNLKKLLDEMTEEYERTLEDKKEVSMQLTSQTARLADLECRNNEAETKCSQLEARLEEELAKIRSLENMIEPFRDQLSQFERERAEILAKSQKTEKELEAVTVEYAKALGHRNHLQKIRQIETLVQSREALKKENQKLLAENAKLRASLLNPKAKKDTKDKENVGTAPNSSKSKGLTSDNHEPVNRGSPLQTRNAPAP